MTDAAAIPKRIALITGANKGIGLETARQLAPLGITILLGSRDAGRGEAAAQTLRDEGLDVTAFPLDVTSSDSIQQAAQQIETQYGRLDILINNAGVMLPGDFSPVSQTSLKTLRDTYDTNFFGLIELTQALLPLIRKSNAGRIVNLSSILGSNTLHSQPGSPIYDSKLLAYDSSKAALNSFTIHLAYELKDTLIKVNAAHPGWVKTDIGGDGATMELVDGAKTSVRLAMLSADGPTGGYFHLDDTLPW